MINDLTICAIVLAAGSSKRMGSVNKLLLEVEGVPMVKRVVRAIQEGGVIEIIVVTGFENDRVEACVSELGTRCVFNERHTEGMGTSISRGVSDLDTRSFDGFIVCLGDLPNLKGETVAQVLGAFGNSHGKKIVIPRFRGKRGHPIAFPICYKKKLELLHGDIGARKLLSGETGNVVFLDVLSEDIIQDIDTI